MENKTYTPEEVQNILEDFRKHIIKNVQLLLQLGMTKDDLLDKIIPNTPYPESFKTDAETIPIIKADIKTALCEGKNICNMKTETVNK